MNPPTHFYLLKDFDPDLDYRDGAVISISSAVSLELTRRGISYQILEDFYTEKKLREGEREYFFSQLKWLDRLDAWLQDHIGYCRRHQLNIARAHYQRFKYFCDTIVVQSAVLHAVIEAVGRAKGKATYVIEERPANQVKTLHQFRLRERDILFEDMLPQVCRKFSVPFNIQKISRKMLPASLQDSASQAGSQLKRLKREIKRTMKDVYFIFKYEKIGCPESESTGEGIGVFFPHFGGDHLDPVIKNFIHKKARVYSLAEDRIFCMNDLFPRLIASIAGETGEGEEAQIKADCRQAAQIFASEGREFTAWISENAKIDVHSIVAPYFRTFIEDTCYEVLMKTRNFRRFYLDWKIQYVASHTNSDSNSKSALLAASTLPQIKKVGIQHGSHVFDDLTWPVHDLDVFDYYFTTDGVSEMLHGKGADTEYISPVKIYQSSHYLRNGRDRYLKQKSKKKETKGPKTILYIPTVLGGHLRLFNCAIYPVLWYFEFQKKLLQHFASKAGRFEFIYKHAKTLTDVGEDSIIPYIRDKKFSNIKVVATRVMDSFEDTDAVILDRPSTAFFEVNACSLPTLGICPDFIAHLFNQDILQQFGKSIQVFSDETEAFRKIDQYLAADWNEYIHPLPLSKGDLTETLLRPDLELKPIDYNYSSR